MPVGALAALVFIHCRIGSSENADGNQRRFKRIHCRIGSSEMVSVQRQFDVLIHCRIGSSES